MYETMIGTKDEALCHLFLHCCYKDGEFNEKELDYVSGLFVELELHQTLNFKEEVKKYRSYKNALTDENAYLMYLIKLINPVHDYALYSYCTELELSDALLEQHEEKLLENIAAALGIEPALQDYTKK
jgi:hypothetical protein